MKSAMEVARDAISETFRGQLDGMEARPKMYCSNYASYEECYLTVLTLASVILGSDRTSALEVNAAWRNITRRHGAGNASMAVRVERLQADQKFPDTVGWETMTRAMREVRDLSFPEWRKE